MATNLAIDDRLLDEALKVGGHRTKKATVTEALEEYVRRRRQVKIVELFGFTQRTARRAPPQPAQRDEADESPRQL